jgi:hypothetical protein
LSPYESSVTALHECDASRSEKYSVNSLRGQIVDAALDAFLAQVVVVAVTPRQQQGCADQHKRLYPVSKE